MADYPTLYTTSATPQVLVGDDSLGLGADDVRQGFKKYNNHVHLDAIGKDFLVYDVAIGDEVYIYDEIGKNYFESIDTPVIEYISNAQVRINMAAPENISNAIMYVKAPIDDENNAIRIVGVDLTQDSKLIRFNQDRSRAGFLSEKQLELVYKKSEHFNFALTSQYNSVPLYLFAAQEKIWLQRILLYSYGGSFTFRLRVTKSLTGLVVESEETVVTAGELIGVTYMENEIPQDTADYTGFLSTSLTSGDLLELVIDSVIDGSPTMLAGTIDLIRVL